MNFTSFTQLILKSLQEELGEGYTVLSETVNKNNGVTRTGITIKREGQNAFPTIYIDHFYKEDMTKEEILLTADRLFESLADAELEEKVDLSGFAEFDSAREKIAYKVISAEKNRRTRLRASGRTSSCLPAAISAITITCARTGMRKRTACSSITVTTKASLTRNGT